MYDIIVYVTFLYLRSKAQTGVYNLCTTANCGMLVINHPCGLPNMEQIFTPFQVNENKISLSKTLECSYLLLLFVDLLYILNLQCINGYF